MTNGLLVIISSGEEAPDKALTGMMYALNAKKNNWIENVNMIFFGPSEKFISESPPESRASQLLKNAIEIGITPVACKAISDGNELTTSLQKLGFEVEYVGLTISSYIKKDYQVLTF